MFYWNLEGKERRTLNHLKDDVEQNICSMTWLVNEDERRSDREKMFLMGEQLEQLLYDFRRLTSAAERILMGEDNCFFIGKEKEEIKYYN